MTGNSACFGGLVGQNDGTITGSYATGTVTGTGDSAYDGGLAGYNDGTISGSYATGTVTVTSDDASVGGLVGYNYGTISGSYATGTVTGTGNSAYAGGLVGANEEGSITNSYATGTVIGTGNSAYAGGLVGANGYDNGDYSAIGGNITNAYATGKVTGTGNSAYAGGLVGYKSGGSVTNSFWDKVTTGQTTSAGSAINYGKTTAELKTLATFTGAGWNIDAAGGTGKVWRIYAGYTYPLLRGFLTPATATVTGSAVSKVYDGMTVATGGTLSYMWNDPAPSDMTKIIVGLTGPYTTINKNVGNNKSIILGGLYSVQDGYDIIINPASTATVTITPLTLTGSTIVSGSSIYGASLAPGAVDFSKSNAIVGDILTATVTVNTAGQTSTSGHLTAGTHTGIESASTLNGTDAGNYTFAGVTGDYSVTPLTLTGSTIATDSSIYASDLNPGAVSFNNIVGTDKVTSTATVDVSTMSSSGKPIVGTYKQTAGAITGADAGNYSFTGFTSAKNYTINQRALTGAAIAESSSLENS